MINIDLTGKSVIVTGGASGIGKGICKEFAAHGANIVVCDLNMDGAQKVSEEIIQSGGKSIAVKIDVTCEKDFDAVVQKAIETYGRIDIMCNNAGIIAGMKKTENVTAQEWDKTFAVNTKGVFLGCKAVIPQMRKQGYGRIINTASMMGKTAGDMMGHYSASKAAVILLTQSFGRELADANIHVNCVCPGSVDTDMTKWEADRISGLTGEPAEQIIQKWRNSVPVGRLAEPRDIAKVFVFLASEYADYMTGQAINVSGGLEMH